MYGSALRDAYFDEIENLHHWISCFETRTRTSYFQSHTSRREREFYHSILCFETRSRNSVVISRDSRWDRENCQAIFSFYSRYEHCTRGPQRNMEKVKSNLWNRYKLKSLSCFFLAGTPVWHLVEWKLGCCWISGYISLQLAHSCCFWQSQQQQWYLFDSYFCQTH